MRNMALLVFLMLAGCASPPPAVPGAKAVDRKPVDRKAVDPKPVDRKPNEIYVGMPFSQAEARLVVSMAWPVKIEVELSRKAVQEGVELHYYRLSSGGTMEILSKPGKAGRLVAFMSVSPSTPKLWKGKMDPEYDRFFRSFERQDAYVLEKMVTIR
jgi:hypothetical protein